MSDALTYISWVVSSLSPIMTYVQPIAIASVFLYFIRSFFD